MKIAIVLLFGSAFALMAADSPVAAGGVKVVRPEQPPDTVALRLPARTVPAEHAEIFSRATGIVSERRVDIGDKVNEGDVLAVIDAPEVRLRVERAQAGVAQAEARATLARTALERARSMSRNRVIAEEALDERDAAAKTAEADLLAARADLHRTVEEQNFLTIRAPFDGVIAVRRIDRGTHIEGDQFQPGTGLFEVARLDELRVEVNAPPNAAIQLAPGQKASIEFPELAGRKFDAVVTRSARVIDTQSGTMRFELVLPNADLAIPSGLTGTATIQVPQDAGRLLVPTNAVTVRDGKPHVATVTDGRVRFVAVQTGRNLGTKVEILSGIKPEDSVITSPNALLSEGAVVQTK
jgi:RND family efflux transporter MFP subunit